LFSSKNPRNKIDTFILIHHGQFYEFDIGEIYVDHVNKRISGVCMINKNNLLVFLQRRHLKFNLTTNSSILYKADISFCFQCYNGNYITYEEEDPIGHGKFAKNFKLILKSKDMNFIKEIDQPDAFIIDALELKSKMIVIWFEDHTMIVINLSNEVEMKLVGHKEKIVTICKYKDNMFSLSEDGNLRIWNQMTWECISSAFYVSEKSVISMLINDLNNITLKYDNYEINVKYISSL